MSCGNPHATPCHEVDAHLDEFLDRELTDDEIRMLVQHFQECPPCKGKLDTAQRLKERIARICGCAAPSELRMRVMRRITEIRSGSLTVRIEEQRIFPE